MLVKRGSPPTVASLLSRQPRHVHRLYAWLQAPFAVWTRNSARLLAMVLTTPSPRPRRPCGRASSTLRTRSSSCSRCDLITESTPRPLSNLLKKPQIDRNYNIIEAVRGRCARLARCFEKWSSSLKSQSQNHGRHPEVVRVWRPQHEHHPLRILEV